MPRPRDAGAHDTGSAPHAGDAAPPLQDAATLDAAGTTSDSGRDAGGTCPLEVTTLWPGYEEGAIAYATRVPLSALCADGCPDSLADIADDLLCHDAEDAGVDAPDADVGCDFDGWIRRDGCGSVQFDTVPCRWPRHYTFDAVSGELIGAARFDDVTTEVPGTTCQDAGYVAGTLKASCAGEVVQHCDRKR